MTTVDDKAKPRPSSSPVGKSPVRVALTALGCKTNQYEMDALAESLRERSYEIVDCDEAADVYVLNTCTVTAEAERKARQMLRRFRREQPDAVLVATGCYAEQRDLSRWAEVVVGTSGRSDLPALIAQALREKRLGEAAGEAASFDGGTTTGIASVKREKDGGAGWTCSEIAQPISSYRRANNRGRFDTYEELGAVAVPKGARAFLKIQDGCDHRCTYCAITLARGPARSRALDAIVDEATALVGRGYREINLTGTNINLYGVERGDRNLLDVLEALERIDGLERIRLGSLDPAILTAEAVDRLSSYKKLCPHFHLSVQSGSDDILRKMGRTGTKKQYVEVADRLRAAFPIVGMTADLMVGFPGETEADFLETVSLCDRMRFIRMHVFPYSRRPGTPAANRQDQVPRDVALERAGRLRAMSSRLTREAITARIGQVREVLVERRDREGRFCGYTEDYLYVRAALPDPERSAWDDTPGGEKLGQRVEGRTAVTPIREGDLIRVRMAGVQGRDASAVVIK